jgi:hypothetical protein
MGSLILSLLVAAYAADPPADPQQQPVASYKTAKTLTVLEQCLTDSLSKLGDVTAVKFDKSTTLMLRAGTEVPMLIDIAPPSVTVTTRFAYGTRPLVKACL